MSTNEKPVYEQNYTDEERKLAEHIIGLEKAALDKWFNGDTSGYEQLWSKHSFTYFDAVVEKRVDDHAAIAEFLKTIDGKLHADSYDFRDPRVQIGKDMAVLTYQLFADTNLIDMEYNCIEVYQKEEDGVWRVIHSTWSFIRPMEKRFKEEKDIV
ncbi:MAG: nuclear transport factor 2 family protein [Alistipes sp.]|uniref:YybH family protein n=1 Tax=Alistipes sp. TaxID=1872444 RepID=UPI0025BD8235|nr:nuclear transport factor 2 family protein [Alistipes sp.]MCD8273962.1 nuclear transport factor 2 family protein [Alistipes sp.]